MKKINVSIIIPTYNRKEYLKTILLALSKQNFPKERYEIIVVDDGNDETNKMIKELKIPNLRYFKIKNLDYECVSRLRNFGIKKVKNEIIIFVDNDIIVTPNFISEHIKNHIKNKKLVVIGYTSALETKKQHNHKQMMKIVKENYDTIVDVPIIPEYRDQIYEECSDNLNNYPKPWDTFLSGNVSVRKQHLIDAGMFDENFKGWGLEDIELGYRLAKKGLRFKLNRKAIGYHIGTDKILNPYLNPSPKKWRNYIRNMKYFLKKNDNLEVKATLVIHDRKIPSKFRVFKNGESVKKKIEFNNWKLLLLSDKQKLLLKNRIKRKWRKIEEKIENLEIKKGEIENKKVELLRNNKIFDEWTRMEYAKQKLQKIFNEKFEEIRNPKREELGELLEKENLIIKGKSTESLSILKLKIKILEKELESMWNKEFEYIHKEITKIMGRENLLLKTKSLDGVLKKLDKEKRSLQSKIDVLKDEQSLMLEKYGILREWNKIEEEKKDVESKIQLLNLKLKTLELNNQTS